MKLFIVGCLFDYYVYTISTKRTFSLVHMMHIKRQMMGIPVLFALLNVLLLVILVFLHQ